MARKKTTIAYIAKDANRRVTFKKRRQGFLKKIDELAILCDVKACAVIYEPDTNQLDVWPNEHEARRMLQQLKDMSQLEQSKKMLNQEGYLRERMEKLQAKLRRITSENHQLEMDVLMHDGLAGRSLRGLSVDKMSSLGRYLDFKEMIVQERLSMMKTQIPNATATATDTDTATATATDTATTTNGQMFFASGSSSSTGGLEEIMQPFMNIDSSCMHFPF